MGIEKRLSRAIFAPNEIVELRQTCFTSTQMFAPGTYPVEQLPDIAFEMGLVEPLRPSQNKDAKEEQL